MLTQNTDDMTRLICEQLGYERPPVTLTPKEVSEITGATIGTLEVWRSTKRYPLPFIKVGRRVRYPLEGVARFLIERTNA